MTMKPLACALLTATALLGTGLAQAQATDPAAPMAPAAPMKAAKAGKALKLDANSDGFVSREEAQSHGRLASHFDQGDLDKDGRLSTAELKTLHDSMPTKPGKTPKPAKAGKGPQFGQLDTNGDQMLSREEVTQNGKMARHFDAADANKDGKLTADEFAAAKQSRGK
jgi:EF hand